jgi:predicted  nucleic acid-binding Zn-ribbon protein
MTVPQLALQHQRLETREAQLRAHIERLEDQLARNPEVERLEEQVATGESARRELDLRVMQQEREAEAHRAKVRSRERELMSGRIHNPGELVRLSSEVEHMKAALVEEEDAELLLLEEQERLDKETARARAELDGARARGEAAAPGLREGLEGLRADLAEVSGDREATWAELPSDWQKAYRRARVRYANPVAEVMNGQCQACHVSVTSNGMQVLRRAGLLSCDNCGRLLVVA